jgi:hypothetical protein
MAGQIGPVMGWEYSIDPLTGKEQYKQPGGIETSIGVPKTKAKAKVSPVSGVNSLSGVTVAKPALDLGPQISTAGVVKVEPLLAPNVVSGAIDKQTTQNKQQYEDYKKGQLMLAGAQFAIDVFNANSAYNTAKGQASLNIIQSRNQAADAIFRGRQAQVDAQSEGVQAGKSALLSAAAQGQDIQGAGVEKIQGSLEAIGIMNGMREEINSMREALGFKLEEVNYDYQVAQAGQAKKNAIIGSALNLAASAYANRSGVV